MELFLRPCFTSKFSTLHEVLGWKNDLNYEFLLEYMKKQSKCHGKQAAGKYFIKQ